jgi:hypothetical protein
MKKPILLSCLMAILFSSVTVAQKTTPKTDTVKQTSVTFLLGPTYAPLLNYYGRTDSLKSSALLPTIDIEFDSLRLYVSATSIFINDKPQILAYAGAIIEAGYRFGKKLKGFGGDVNASNFFYNTTQLPQSALKEGVGTNLYYLYKYINFSASANLGFSDKTDVFTSIGINRIFKKVKRKNTYVAAPAFVANMGTQNYTTSANNPSILPGIIPSQQELQNSSRFSLLDYELSMPLIYARNHVYVIVTPSYIVPENVVTVPGHPAFSEKANDLFYINLTFLYSIKAYKYKVYKK